MTDLMVFVENHESGGATKYVESLIGSARSDFSKIIIFCNHGAFSVTEQQRNRDLLFIESDFLTLYSQYVKASHLKTRSFFLRKVFSLGLRLLEIPIQVINFLYFSVKLFQIKPTRLLVVNGGYPGSLSSQTMILAARCQRIYTVLSVVSMPTPRHAAFKVFEKIYDLIVWKASDTVITNTLAIKESLCLERDLIHNSIFIIPNGIPDLIDPKLVHSWDPERSKINIAFVGRVSISKGANLLFEAYCRVLHEFKDSQLFFVGQGELSQDLMRICEPVSVNKHISFLGQFDGKIEDFLQNIDILVIPSLWEGLPYVLLEGLRSGNAIIATSVGGIPYAVTDHLDALLIAPGSVLEIEIALRKLLSEGSLRKKLGDAARATYLKTFNLAETHKDVMDALNRKG